MAVSTSDMAALGASAAYLARVKAELAIQCFNVASETITTASLMLHVRRAQFASQVLQSLNNQAGSNWALAFAITSATDTSVINDATQNGNIALTSSNADTAQASVTDTHLGNAISAEFNAFLQPT